ncbi:MAG: hypothetical protein ACI9A1_001185, partial [Lentimonas sp.]
FLPLISADIPLIFFGMKIMMGFNEKRRRSAGDRRLILVQSLGFCYFGPLSGA